MSESKHTPGPWTIEPLQATHGADLAIVGGPEDDRTVVCVIQHDPEIQAEEEEYVDGYNVQWHPDQLPAARLIATAPELLEALEELEQLVSAHISEEADNWCKSARAAIAKAKGTL